MTSQCRSPRQYRLQGSCWFSWPGSRCITTSLYQLRSCKDRHALCAGARWHGYGSAPRRSWGSAPCLCYFLARPVSHVGGAPRIVTNLQTRHVHAGRCLSSWPAAGVTISPRHGCFLHDVEQGAAQRRYPWEPQWSHASSSENSPRRLQQRRGSRGHVAPLARSRCRPVAHVCS